MRNLIVLLSFFVSSLATAGLAERIYDKAVNYRSGIKYVQRDGRRHTELYGYIIDDKLTRYGRWGCATVVSTTLKAAGVRIGFKYAVHQVESSLRRWRKIWNASEVQAGDVIVWHKAGHDKICSGGGDCHVGISLGGSRTFENRVMSGKPGFSSINKFGWRFKVALRPR